MSRRRGLQAEILLSLSLAMGTASAVLVAVLLRTHDAQVEQLRTLAARSLLREARSPLGPGDGPGRWAFVAMRDGDEVAAGSELDAESRTLAREAHRRGRPLLRAGAPWEPIRFAAPAPGGRVALARLPPAVPRSGLLALLAADLAIFTGFGAYLLRRRLVLPLRRLADAARAVAEGGLDARVPVEGGAETSEVATAFNGMTEALGERTCALEKAVADLRESNRQLREARAGLARAERHAVVGRLAAGVAHEVGNPLGAILAFVDVVGRDPGLSPESRRHLERVTREGGRVRSILRRLLDFARTPAFEPTAVDCAALAEEAATLVRAQRRYAGIGVDVEAQDAPPPAWADRGALSQILLNLLLNAADAVRGARGEGGGGRIRIAIRPAAGERRRGEEGAASAAGRRDAVEIAVEDDGPGVPEEDRERIFDPFFTTKPPGEGTGLGLPSAARCAEDLGGSLELDPAPREAGCAFVLRLPAAQPAPPRGARVRG